MDKGFMTVTEVVADHSYITEDDVRMCAKGVHPTLPPLRAKKKSAQAAGNQPYLFSREALRDWREKFPDA